MAGVASVMCSYSESLFLLSSVVNCPNSPSEDLINQTYACENDKTINDILKREFGFRGYVMSDWSATESTFGSVASGLDVRPSFFTGDLQFMLTYLL